MTWYRGSVATARQTAFMEHRFIRIGILVFWLSSMTWLVTTKILPLFDANSTPDQRVFIPESSQRVQKAHWKIRWNDRPMGWAQMTTTRQKTGFGHTESVVRFEDLPADELLQELFGKMGPVLRLLELDQLHVELTLEISSQMEFDPFGTLERFRSSVALDSFGELFRLKGQVKDTTLRLDVIAGNNLTTDEQQPGDSLFQKEFELPPDAFVADALTPQSRLADLQVGQTWRFRAYRAFPPQSPFRIVVATVDRVEMMAWEDIVEPVSVVSFADGGGSGLTAASEPFSQLWVRDDGTVLRQQMQLGNVQVDFVRQAVDDEAAK